jgi:hypothetical protein
VGIKKALRYLPWFVLCALMALSSCQSSATDREITFPGAGGVTLKGSVLQGGAHRFFAVLVAGSGPTDRNWSSSLIAVASHAGREVARWLQGRGIGSLRFDKRFIGVNDPGMDVGFGARPAISARRWRMPAPCRRPPARRSCWSATARGR